MTVITNPLQKMDMFINGQLQWDLGLSLTAMADLMFEDSVRAEMSADYLRMAEEEYNNLAFKCACHAMAFLALKAKRVTDITPELIESESLLFIARCRTHRFNALECLNRVRLEDGQAPIMPDDPNYLIQVCDTSATRHDWHHCHCKLHHRNDHSDVVEKAFMPAELIGGKPPVLEEVMANVWHPEGFTMSDVIKWDWFSYGSVIQCIHCRPHLAVMARYWMAESTSIEATTETNQTITQYRQARNKELLNTMNDMEPLKPMTASVTAEIQKIENRVHHPDDFKTFTYHPQYSWRGQTNTNLAIIANRPYLDCVVAMKNSVNARRLKKQHPLGASSPQYPTALVSEKLDVFGGLGAPEDFWVLLIQTSMCMVDNPEEGDLSDVQSAHILVESRKSDIADLQEKLKKLQQAPAKDTPAWERNLNLFEEALLAEKDDDTTWRLFEKGDKRRTGFMHWLEMRTISMSLHPRYKSLVATGFWPLPKITNGTAETSALYERTRWFIRQQWLWHLKMGQTETLVRRVYVHAPISSIGQKTPRINHARGLLKYGEWMVHGGADEKWMTQYVNDAFTVYQSFLL